MQPPDSIESRRWSGFYWGFFLLDPSWMSENQTGKKLWAANANRTRNNTWIPEKIFGGSLELVNPRSTANCVALPIIWTKPATAVRAKPLLNPVPFNPLERIRDRVVTTSTAPMAITSNATATVSKDPGTEMLNESPLKKLL